MCTITAIRTKSFCDFDCVTKINNIAISYSQFSFMGAIMTNSGILTVKLR